MLQSALHSRIHLAMGAWVVLLLAAPYVEAQLEGGDGVFLVQLQNEAAPFEVRADRLVTTNNNGVLLETEDRVVAVFQRYQAVYVVRKTEGERTFEVRTQQGNTERFEADRLAVDKNGLLNLYAGGTLIGVVSINVQYVAEVDALVR